MSSSQELRDQIVELINDAKLAPTKDKKTYLLAQVQEICLNRDDSLLPDVIPMVVEFQTDFNSGSRKFVVSFLKDVVTSHPSHVALAVPVATYLLKDENANVRKSAAILAITVYRPALQRLVTKGAEEGAQKDWTALESLRKSVLQLITTGPPDIFKASIKFAETVVLACVGGRGLGPTSSREGDESVQRNLSLAHPFLRADTLDQAGRALAQQMVRWLESGITRSGGGKSGGGVWGPGFVAEHYTMLVQSLQRLATNKAALFSTIVPALAAALEGASRATAVGSDVGTGTPAVSKELRGAASSIRSACLKLLKVAPAAGSGVQRMAIAAARAGSDGEAKAAVEGNSALRGRIRIQVGISKGRQTHAASPSVASRILPATPENRRAMAGQAVASLRRLPPPPPGQKHRRTPGFPLDMEGLIGHVLNALGPDIAAGHPHVAQSQSGTMKKRARSPEVETKADVKRRATGVGAPVSANPEATKPADQDSIHAAAGIAVGPSSAPSSAAVEENKDNAGVVPMDEDGKGGGKHGGNAGGSSVVKPETQVEEKKHVKEPPPAETKDPVLDAVDMASKAFNRVVKVWEGAATEGKRGLHQRLVSRLGRIVAEGEVAGRRLMVDKEVSMASEAVVEVVSLVKKDYRKHFEAALALLMDMYVAETATRKSGSHLKDQGSAEPGDGGGGPKEGGIYGQGYAVYDSTLMCLLQSLALSLEASPQQRLFTQTLLACPRVPQAALEFVCNLCNLAGSVHEVQTGLVSLKELIFHKPATRDTCVPSVLRFTFHPDLDVRTKAVRLTANLLWSNPAFKAIVESFAKQALASLQPREEPSSSNDGGESNEPKVSGDEVGRADCKEKGSHYVTTKEEIESTQDKNTNSENILPDMSPAPPAPTPWSAPPQTEGATRVRLSLYFALCVKSHPLLTGLLEAYSTTLPVAQKGIMAELPMLAKAAATRFGAPGVVGLISTAVEGAEPLVLAMLDLLVPKDVNVPSLELVTAVRRLRDVRTGKGGGVGGGGSGSGKKAVKGSGIAYLVPVLAGFGKEAIPGLMPEILQADEQTVRAAFSRLTHPLKGAIYTPVELFVLLNRFDFIGTKVPVVRLNSALSLCMENKSVYNYSVLREALNVMTQPPTENANTTELPRLLMRTVMVSIKAFPELRNFVATAVLPRLVKLKVWTDPKIWLGFLLCANMMATESGATSFIALVQLPSKQLQEALANPKMKGVKEPLRRYAESLVKVDSGVRAVLGMEAV